VTVDNFTISAKIVKTGDDIVIIIGGGKSHIGAVGVSFPTVSIINGDTTITTSVITLPSHKDDIVAKMVSETVAKKLNKKVIVIAGIHFDNLSKNDIDTILKACNELSFKIIEKLG
jgi:hypothetical protein